MEVRAVIDKTLCKWLSLVFVLALPSSAVCSQVRIEEALLVSIAVHNDAGVPLSTLLGAEAEASRLFQQSGVVLRWLNCPLPADGPEDPGQCRTAQYPAHLQLRIARRSRSLNEFTFGISYLSADGSGCYADLFYEPVEEMHGRNRVNLAGILGDVAAHEIGHLLLGTNSHARSGIMRARWQSAELGSIRTGTFFFSGAESRQMRSRLAAWRAPPREASEVATARLGD
jgi:hypothetical protein